VVSRAKRHAFFGWAMLMGASITSGGTGKKEDSAKLSAPRYQGALGWRDHAMARR